MRQDGREIREQEQEHQVWLSLGSNMGDRFETLIGGAVYLLTHGLKLICCSGVYETEPVGYADQPDFYNMVLHGASALEPLALLALCQQAEKAYLRERVIHWGPRTLDVDILYIGEMILDMPELTIPHPRIPERAFVLGPLADMEPGILEKWKLSAKYEGIRLIVPAQDVLARLTKAGF